MNIVTSYKNYTAKADEYISKNVTQIPKGFVHNCLQQFIMTLVMTTALSKQNRLITGLKSGTLDFLATIINLVALKKIKSYCEKNGIKLDLKIVSFVLKEAIYCLLQRKNPLDHAKTAALTYMLQKASNGLKF